MLVIKFMILVKDKTNCFYRDKILWNCVTCDSSESPWLCLACGLIFCGRFVNAHGLKHHNEMKYPRHCVLMHCQTYEVFWYAAFFVPTAFCIKKVGKEKSKDFTFSPSCSPSPESSTNHVIEKQPRQRVELRGLKNLGNTLEYESYFKTARKWTYSVNIPDFGIKLFSVLAEELRKVLIRLGDLEGDQAVSPDEFFQSVWKVSPRFRGYHQQDAHEFLRCTMDRLHSELRRCRLPESVTVTTLFEGLLQSQVVCLTCHTASNKHDPFLDLSLDIFVPAPNGRASNVRLSECIKRFFAKEELDHCEQYMCSNCKDKRPSTKQLFLRVLPNVLCLHLKRFRWSHISRGKLDNMVDFPLTSRVTDQPGNFTFDLSSVVVHHGSGVTSGHYTTYGQRDGLWYHFNDATVKACSEQTVLKQKAYLLFYTRSTRFRL
ncbi:unnamed protein product [Angiostrongylus costaricensis]|uniref:ubiquitinyl hydrolase 1 n=1 Tax=Angiostrongylus costaricensis TaxID=334426 RepID=A0A158PJI4_ANGCS|nr:unnamed protein product [Angiostrongylus costaricensis]